MSRRFKPLSAFAAVGVFLATGVVAFLPVAYASPAIAPVTKQLKPSGLTSWGIANARRNGAASAFVRMAPQGNLTLLSRAENLGSRESSAAMKLTISLKLRKTRKLKQFLEEVQNPGSSQYHHFLTPQQFARQYGPTQTQVDVVKKFLQRNQIQVQSISANRTLIHAVGTTGAFERAFSIRINNYKLNGRTFPSTKDRIRIPRAVAGVVLNVLGLDHFQMMRPHSNFKPLPGRAGVVNSQVSLSPPAATSSSAYFDPSQIATAYDWPSITDQRNGEGVSVAIITADSSGLGSNDSASAFWNAYGLPSHTVNVIPVDGDEGLTDGMGETLLDIEWSGAMAPGITQNVYLAANPYFTTFVDAFNEFVNDDTSQVMTTSWGAPEFYWGSLGMTADQIFMQGAAEGISMFAAAGDNGAADIPNGDGTGNNADFPSSSPYITTANGSLLTIADISGTYGSETAWSPSYSGAPGTGGAISQLFTQPSWQTGPGVPSNGMRMNSDMALNSGGQNGSDYVVYDSQRGFGAVYGTSAVAPQLAALFAIGVSQNSDVSLGQSNTLIYGDVNAGNYAADFHDITTGCNGELPDGSSSCAAVDWDHPTGWGSPNATSFLSHLGVTSPSGTLSGTVTDVDGNPVAGAEVSVDGSYEGPTGTDGNYSFVLPAGSHAISVGAFGYALGTASVSVTDSATTTQDFTLDAAPTDTVSGKVTDGSGHGYGLYAEVSVTISNSPPGYGKPKDLQVADIWTDPATGAYSVKLPQGYGYAIHVAAAFDGYQTVSKTVTVSADVNENFPLAVASTCSAPGYQFQAGGFSNDFNNPSFPPTGWTVTNPASSPVIWELSNAPGNYGNQTGGTGTAAEANGALGVNYSNNPPYPAFDTSLVTPPISATSLTGAAVLRYKAFYGGGSTMPFDLDITTDGGSTWTNILHWTSGHPANGANGEDESVDLSPYLPTSGDFQLRWRFYGPASYSSTLAQIDDVVIGTCQPVSGGLVMGQVSDANTGKGILGAHVADGNGTNADTVENYSDPNLPVGFYLFFDKAGQYTLTTTAASNYSTATAGITLNDNSVVTQNFALKTAKMGANPGQFTLHVMVNSSATASFALSNAGSAPGQYRVVGIDAPAPATQQSPATGGGAPLIQVPVANPSWLTASLSWVSMHAQSKAAQANSVETSPTIAPSSSSAPVWQAIAPYPKETADNTMARDPVTGKVYSMGGTYSQYGSVVGIDSSAFVYDPKDDSWSPIANAPVARQAAASAFIDGKYYVADGWAAGAAANPVAETDIYDPVTGQWSTGASNPVPAAGGSAYAVLNGSLYLVGGCIDGPCSTPTNAVQVYHPYSDSWTSAANYPQAVAFASCGAIDGKLYCAGGMQGSAAVGDGYVYDPLSNSWSSIAPMFVPLGESFYTAANGLLLVDGGVDGGGNLVNEGEAYDPQTNSWFPLPNLPTAITRGGHACGLYQTGGITAFNIFGPVITNVTRVLPGYTQQCGKLPQASWLSMAPATGTLQAGATATIQLTVDGTGQKAFTTSRAYLSVANKSPYGPINVPVTIDWEPQPVALKVSGTADPTSVKTGTNVTFDFTVTNEAIKGDGTATQTVLTVNLPSSLSFVTEQGSSCSSNAGVVVCPIGDLAQGDQANVVLVAHIDKTGEYEVMATASAQEPQDGSVNNSTTVANKAPSSSGGGSFGWPVLALLFGLAILLGRKQERIKTTS